MVVNEITKRLQQSNWAIECNTTPEVNLVLQSCENAGIGWKSGDAATKFKPNETYPLYIIFCNYDKSLIYVAGNNGDYSEKNGYKNITSWFFSALKGKNND